MDSPLKIRLRDGRCLAYRECGDPHGLPVIYCHGATVSGLDVLTGDDAASDLGIRLIAPNRPGIGASTNVRHRALRHWAIDCSDLAQALELERFGNLGLSMGGQYALALAAFLPERVDAVVVCAGATPLDHHQALQDLHPRLLMLTWPVGTLLGLTAFPLLAFFRSLLPLVPTLLPMLSWTRSCLTPPAHQQASADELTLPPFQQDHAFAAFEQGDWLAELDLLQLGTALQRTAISRGGYDGRSFDVMVAIADVLEADHGWSFEQSDAWLERMGLWEEEF